jgi:hypothetical protein
MNGRLSKRIRRVARQITAGKPATQYVRRDRVSDGRQLNFMVDPNCTRGAEKTIKRVLRHREAPPELLQLLKAAR